MEERNVPEGFEKFAKVEKMEPSEYFGMVCSTDRFLGEAEARFKEANIKVQTLCEFGNPADKIINTAEHQNVDLILIGSRGLGGFSKTFMGSVSTKVCNHAQCTCITVK